MTHCSNCKKKVRTEAHGGSVWCTECGAELEKIFVSEEPNPKDAVGGSGNYGEKQNKDEEN